MFGRRDDTHVAQAAGSCAVHTFEYGQDSCGRCHDHYCQDCLVYPFGPRKAPLCIQCALVTSGIRRPARKPAFSY
ncbi:MAG TPA: hypothetical protein VGI06_02605 [Acidimicrobiales bacterium]